jgi:transposase-like protein
MATLLMTNLEHPITCPVCNAQWFVSVVEVEGDGRHRETCPQCKRPYFRDGHTGPFRSPDGRRLKT